MLKLREFYDTHQVGKGIADTVTVKEGETVTMYDEGHPIEDFGSWGN